MKLIFLDTETTGTEEKDRLCQVAYKREKEVVNELFYPQMKIPPQVSAVCHITNKMLEGKPEFIGSETFIKLQKYLLNGDILVAHNAKFDIAMLEREGIKVPKHICTYKVARFLDKEAKLPSYGLQYLRYLLELELDVQAHDALGDIIVLEHVFKRLEKGMKEISKEDVYEKMIEISMNPMEIKRLAFGKHKGKLVTDAFLEDSGWFEWLYREKKKEELPDEDWIYTLEKLLNIKN